MRTTKVIQIGDIHFPKARQEAQIVDFQDNGVPSALVNLATPNRLQQLAKKAANLCSQDKDLVAILICGDLTTAGDMLSYECCFDYLRKSLAIDDGTLWDKDGIHVVPGNHDVERSKVDPTGADSRSKFDTITMIWNKYHQDILPIAHCRHTQVGSQLGQIDLLSLNSCLGCGEWRSRLLPAGGPEGLRQDFDTALNTEQHADSEKYERLDTPAFRDADVQAVSDAIGALPEMTIPVVLSHHNILPQAMPRIALYTEVINGGVVRARLARCGRAVIYCHGHIHDDPIEVIHQPSSSAARGGRLICISAPEFGAGFNVISIHYSGSGHPIGCAVHAYRIQADGDVTARLPEVRIPLYNQEETVSKGILSDLTKILISKVISKGQDYSRFPKIREELRGAQQRKYQSPTIADALLEAEWTGFISILDREKQPDLWTIRRNGV